MSASLFSPLATDAFNLVKLTALWVFGLCAAAFWIISCLEGRIWAPPARLGLVALTFIIVASVSTAASATPLPSLVGLYSRYGGLLSLLLYALIALALFGLYWQKPLALRQVAFTASAASSLLAAFVLFQEAGLDWNEWRSPVGDQPVSPIGTLGNSNFAGGYLAVTLPFLVFWARVVKQTPVKVLLGALVGIDLLALWYTQARGAMVGAAAGLAAVAFYGRERIPRWMKRTIVAGTLFMASLAVAVIWHPWAERSPEALSQVRQLDSFSIKTRFWYWTSAGRILKSNPILGTGPDTYLFHYPRYRVAEDGQVMGMKIPDKPHNILLEHLSNEGLLGGGAYLATLGLAAWYAWRAGTSLEGEERMLLGSFFGALAAYTGQGFFSIDVPPLAVMGWIILGGIAAIADPAAVRARQKIQDRTDGGMHVPPVMLNNVESAIGNRLRLPAAMYSVSLFLLVSALIFFGIRPIRADVRASMGKLEEAIQLNPFEAQYQIQAGNLAASIASSTADRALATRFFKKAEIHYRQALSIQPSNIMYLARMGGLHTDWAQNLDPAHAVQAERWWRRVRSFDPMNKDVQAAYQHAREVVQETKKIPKR